MKIHNPSDIWPVPAQFQQIYSHAVEAELGGARQLHVSGQVGVRADGTVPADFAAQCDQAIENVEAVLRSAQMTMSDVLKLTYYVVRRDDLPLLNEKRLARWRGIRPAVTTLLVAGLVRPEFLIEIDVLAQTVPAKGLTTRR
jgi:enamine deaminase RidA (YjgF/YER057c/UK114 family)